MQRGELERGKADPIGQRAAVDADALGLKDLRLPVQRQMPGIFGDQHVSDERLGGHAALDEPCRRRSLRHAVSAGTASVFGPARNDDAQPGGNPVEPLGDILADHMQGAAAGADFALRLDDDLLARQVRRQVAAIGAPVLGAMALGCLALLLRLGVLGRYGGLDILQRQVDLLLVQPLGGASEPAAAQHHDDVVEAGIVRLEPIDLGGQRCLLLAPRRLLMLELPALAGQILTVGGKPGDQCLQAFRVLGKGVERQRHGCDIS